MTDMGLVGRHPQALPVLSVRFKYGAVSRERSPCESFLNSVVVFLLCSTISLTIYFAILLLEYKNSRALQGLRLSVISGDRPALGALVSDIACDHLRALPTPRRHERGQLLTGSCEVPRHADAGAVSAVGSHPAAGVCCRRDTPTYGPRVKAEHQPVPSAIGPQSG